MEVGPSYFQVHRGFIQKHFLLLLLAAYVVATFWPWLGIVAKEICFARFAILNEHVSVTLLMTLLALLLFNAGLSADISDLVQVGHRPQVVLAGLGINLLVPIAFLFVVYPILRLWHDPGEVQHVVLGLAVVAAMPIAGSSTASAQNANGNVALSLGLVVLSTLFCPVTTPLTLMAFGSVSTGEHSEALHRMSSLGTGIQLSICVLIPSLSGLAVRHIAGKKRITATKPGLKYVNSSVLLFLCYANASIALPQMAADPDWDFLAMILVIVIGLCLSAFAAGWLLANVLNLDDSHQRSMMFGLGMNNNGTGMVLAGTAFSAMPSALMPVLMYNLVQHLIAAGIDRALNRNQSHVRYH